MKIWEINEAIENAEIIDPDTGEFVALDEDALNALAMERDEKIENLCCWQKNEEATAKAIAEQIRILTKRKAAAERKAESLKQYVGAVLNGAKFKTARTTVLYRTSHPVEILDVDMIPDDCVEIERKPMKKVISALLEAGMDVPGAHLIEKRNVIIR